MATVGRDAFAFTLPRFTARPRRRCLVRGRGEPFHFGSRFQLGSVRERFVFGSSEIPEHGRLLGNPQVAVKRPAK
jgi:hypothetical protein